MKIFISFLQSNRKHPIPAYDFWEYYIKNGIVEAGHEWVECPGVDWAAGLVPRSKNELALWRQDAWTQTVAWLKSNPADLFLSYLYPKQIDVTAIKQIQKMGIPCVNFFCDNVRDFKKIPIQFNAFDLNWVPEYKAIKLYKKAGYPYIHLPMPVWIAPQYRKISAEKFNQATFMGSKDIQRQLFFEAVDIQQSDLPIAIYGSGWIKDGVHKEVKKRAYTFSDKLFFQYEFLRKQGFMAYLRKIKKHGAYRILSTSLQSKLHPALGHSAYNELTVQSAVTVGINRYPSFHFPVTKPDTYSRLRDIEAPMLGACYLTEWTPGLDDLYETGKEIEVYYNEEDFVAKTNELLQDKKKREMLRINGQKKALQNHSVPLSINKIASTLGLK